MKPITKWRAGFYFLVCSTAFLLSLINHFLSFTKIKRFNIPKYKDPGLWVLMITSYSDKYCSCPMNDIFERRQHQQTDLQSYSVCYSAWCQCQFLDLKQTTTTRSAGERDHATLMVREWHEELVWPKPAEIHSEKRYIFYLIITLNHVVSQVNGKIYI